MFFFSAEWERVHGVGVLYSWSGRGAMGQGWYTRTWALDTTSSIRHEQRE